MKEDEEDGGAFLSDNERKKDKGKWRSQIVWCKDTANCGVGASTRAFVVESSAAQISNTSMPNPLLIGFRSTDY